MLKQRVITALVLLAILLPALLMPNPLPFAAISLVFIAAAAWEWARLNNLSGPGAVAMGVLVLGAGAAVLLGAGAPWAAAIADFSPATWAVVALLWVVGGAWTLRFGTSRWTHLPAALRWVLGLVVLWLAWVALMHAKQIGLNFLLSVFCMAWAADIAAYFGGRRFGRHKLAPTISPGKSWEGVWSGMAGTLLMAAAWVAADGAGLTSGSPSLYSMLHKAYGWPAVLLGTPALAAMTVVGDLFKSVVKRVAGVKDSSNLLPGHGGVLDRIDALLPLFPLAWALTQWSMPA